MKRKIITVLLVLLLLITLFPLKLQLKDGGSIVYQSLVGAYRVTNWHQMLPITEGEGEKYKEGISVEIFGCEIYNNTLSIPAE